MSLITYSKSYVPKYHWAVDICKQHEDVHWTERDAKLQEDVEQWQRGVITQNEKAFIKNILRLFTESDVNVGENYFDFMIKNFRNNEVRNMLGSFACREGVHQRAYALLNDTLGFGEEFYNEFQQFKEMSDKVEYMHTVSDKSYHDIAVSMGKQVFFEGVSLFSSFVMLMNFDRFGKMAGMSDIVRWSIRDESIHIEGNTKLFREFLDEHPRIVNDQMKSEIYTAARDVVELEDRFIDRAFGEFEIEGITKHEMKEYIRHVANYRLQQLGLKKNWEVEENPIEWTDWIFKSAHGNFFEREITDYSKNNLTGEWVY